MTDAELIARMLDGGVLAGRMIADRFETLRTALTAANARADAAEAALAAQGWQPIETAPKDGVRVMLWRGPASCGQWSEMVIAEWYDGAWRWPDQRENPSTHGEWTEDELVEGYADEKSFTHWMPLPAPPTLIPKEGA